MIHNYLVGTNPEKSDIVLTYGYSAAHKKDPNRALRILKKATKESPLAVREFYYLGREYIYRKDWAKALSASSALPLSTYSSARKF